jgi:hypothetical protein
MSNQGNLDQRGKLAKQRPHMSRLTFAAEAHMQVQRLSKKESLGSLVIDSVIASGSSLRRSMERALML